MSFSTPSRPARPASARPPGRRGALLPTALVVGGVLLAISLASSLYTEFLWFRQLGFTQVFGTRLLTQAALFVLGAALMAAAVAVSLSLAYRTRPIYAPVSQEAQNLDRYRESLEPLRRVVLVTLPALLGLFAGSAAAGQWQTVLLWLNRTPFGQRDPEFNLDIGFFVFTLPLLRFVVGFLVAVLVLSLMAGAATHYLYGGLRLQGPGQRTTQAARVHLAVLAGLLALLQGASYFLDRYARLIEGNAAFVDGAGYTDVTAVIPARFFLAIIAVIVALLFFSTIVTGNWRIPLGGIALLVLVAIVAGGVVPAVIQRFQVRPSELTREREYIERNLSATTAAFGVNGVERQRYEPETAGVQGALSGEAETAASIRLLDPSVVSPAFRQLEQTRAFYGFPDALDVDRYQIDGRSQDTVIAVRELDIDRLNTNSWVNEHIVYTHGYGVVAAAGNQREEDGEPAFIQRGIPSRGVLGEYEEGIYFGESSPDFSIVGAPAGAEPRELDYPDDDAPNGEVRTTYAADGGPRMGDLFTRLLYAIKFRDGNILLSDAVNSESQILYDRNPRQRVQKVAPFLTLDGDPYPAVVDGRVVWIVDGYTTSNAYPYSQRQQLGNITQDSTTQAEAVVAQRRAQVNYIRNSVKATVDAYDGSVNLFAWDEQDPVLASWQKVFPGTVRPLADIDGDLMAHLRYPEDLFKVQRAVLGNYHVADPNSFYTRQDFWENPNDPTETAQNGVKQPPYYLTLQMPGQDRATFSLTSSYIPRQAQGQNRNVLTGFLAVDADAGSEAGQRREGYGQLRLLELPAAAGIAGPGQVQNTFDADPQVANALNLLRAGGATEVIRGNLLTLPIGGGLLYVQPAYVQAASGAQVPLLQRVLVSFGNEIGFAETLDEALDQVFDGNSGATTGDAGTPTTTPPITGTPTPPPAEGAPPAEGTPPAEPAPSPTTPAPAPGSELEAALTDANTALQDGQAALARGDFAAYGEAQDRLEAALQRAIAAEQTAGAPAPAGG